MPNLIAKSALSGQAPLVLVGTTLAELVPERITSVAPLKGQSLDKAMKILGLSFPAPNRFVEAAGAMIVWTGREQAFLIGASGEGLTGLAALTDQTDGWAVLTLQGPKAEAALMRLYPLDLRLAQFGVGRAARAPLNHMSSVLMRTGAEGFTVMVFRSMARTAWHEIETALKALAARALV